MRGNGSMPLSTYRDAHIFMTLREYTEIAQRSYPQQKDGKDDPLNSIPRTRVMIVDDDVVLSDLLETMWRPGSGSTIELVGVAQTGADALALIGSTRPDVVLMDHHLPDMAGVA